MQNLGFTGKFSKENELLNREKAIFNFWFEPQKRKNIFNEINIDIN